MTESLVASTVPYRAFVAVDATQLPGVPAVLTDLAALDADLKPVAAANLHVTLAFLGNVPDEATPRLREAIVDASAPERAFSIEAHGLGSFPSGGAPRVLWIGLRGCEPLARIVDRLRPLLAAIGVETEDRPFSPHLTLARARSSRGSSLVRAFVEARKDAAFGRLRVADVRLNRSTLSPKGPRYDVVESVPLAGAAP
jgi:2'-5' RNA ligase